MKTAYIKLHRWNNSPYRNGTPYTYAIQLCYVVDSNSDYRKKHVGYNSEGQLIQSYFIDQSRTRAIEAEMKDLVDSLRNYFDVKILMNAPYYFYDKRPDKFLLLSELPEVI